MREKFPEKKSTSNIFSSSSYKKDVPQKSNQRDSRLQTEYNTHSFSSRDYKEDSQSETKYNNRQDYLSSHSDTEISHNTYSNKRDFRDDKYPSYNDKKKMNHSSSDDFFSYKNYKEDSHSKTNYNNRQDYSYHHSGSYNQISSNVYSNKKDLRDEKYSSYNDTKSTNYSSSYTRKNNTNQKDNFRSNDTYVKGRNSNKVSYGRQDKSNTTSLITEYSLLIKKNKKFYISMDIIKKILDAYKQDVEKNKSLIDLELTSRKLCYFFTILNHNKNVLNELKKDKKRTLLLYKCLQNYASNRCDSQLTASTVIHNIGKLGDIWANVERENLKEIQEGELEETSIKDAIIKLYQLYHMEFDARAISDIIWSFRKVGLTWQRLQELKLDTLLAENIKKRAQAFDPQAITTILGSLANMGLIWNDIQKQLKLDSLFIQLIKENIKKFDDQGTVNISWALATMQIDWINIEEWKLDQSLIDAINKNSYKFIDQGIANLTWSLAKMGLTWEKIKKLGIDKLLIGKLQEHIPRCNSLHINQIISACATMGLTWQAICDLKINNLLINGIKDLQFEFNSQEAANLSWAFAKMGLTWKHIEELHLDRLFMDIIKNNINEFTRKNLVQVAWAFATMGLFWKKIKWLCMDQPLIKSFERTLESFNASDTVIALWSFSHMDLMWQNMRNLELDGLFLEKIKNNVKDFNRQDTLMIMSIAKMGLTWQRLQESQIDGLLMQAFERNINQLNAIETTDVTYFFAKIGLTWGEFKKLKISNLLIQCIKEHIQEMDMSRILTLLWSFSKMQLKWQDIQNLGIDHLFVEKFKENAKNFSGEDIANIIFNLEKMGLIASDFPKIGINWLISETISQKAPQFNERALVNNFLALAVVGVTRNDIGNFEVLLIDALKRNIKQLHPVRVDKLFWSFGKLGFSWKDIQQYSLEDALLDVINHPSNRLGIKETINLLTGLDHMGLKWGDLDKLGVTNALAIIIKNGSDEGNVQDLLRLFSVLAEINCTWNCIKEKNIQHVLLRVLEKQIKQLDSNQLIFMMEVFVKMQLSYAEMKADLCELIAISEKRFGYAKKPANNAYLFTESNCYFWDKKKGSPEKIALSDTKKEITDDLQLLEDLQKKLNLKRSETRFATEEDLNLIQTCANHTFGLLSQLKLAIKRSLHTLNKNQVIRLGKCCQSLGMALDTEMAKIMQSCMELPLYESMTSEEIIERNSIIQYFNLDNCLLQNSMNSSLNNEITFQSNIEKLLVPNELMLDSIYQESSEEHSINENLFLITDPHSIISLIDSKFKPEINKSNPIHYRCDNKKDMDELCKSHKNIFSYKMEYFEKHRQQIKLGIGKSSVLKGQDQLYSLEKMTDTTTPFLYYYGERVKPNERLDSEYRFEINNKKDEVIQIIDAEKKRNAGAFINHSFNSNAIMEQITVQGTEVIAAFLTEPLEPFKPIYFNYGNNFFTDDKIEPVCLNKNTTWRTPEEMYGDFHTHYAEGLYTIRDKKLIEHLKLPSPYALVPEVILSLLQNDNLKKFEELLKRYGADTPLISIENNKMLPHEKQEYYTALQLACYIGKSDHVRLLLKYGADATYGALHTFSTPLSLAMNEGNSDKIVETICREISSSKEDCNLYATDKYNNSVLDYAEKRHNSREIKNILLQEKPTINLDKEGFFSEKNIKTSPKRTQKKDNKKNTATKMDTSEEEDIICELGKTQNNKRKTLHNDNFFFPRSNVSSNKHYKIDPNNSPR